MTTVRQDTGRTAGKVRDAEIQEAVPSGPTSVGPSAVVPSAVESAPAGSAAVASALVVPAPHGRHAADAHQRRLVREQLLVVAVLVVALAITLALLAQQWLGSGGGTDPTGLLPITIFTGGNT